MQAIDLLSQQLPQLDLMIQAIESERYEGLNGYFSELDQLFGMLYATYLEELRYLAAHEPQNAAAERIGETFSVMRPLVAGLRDDLSLEEYPEALENLRGLKAETANLFALFEEYKRECEKGTRYSSVPYTQELLRVCHHYLDGALSVEAVQGRLELFCQYHELLENQLSTLIPSPPERAAFEERLPDLEEALSLQLQAIEDLDLALERNDEALLKEAMGLLRDAAEALVDVYEHLRSADLQPRRIACIRCGADNSTEARMCGSCGAVLPQSAGSGEPVSTIALEEDGSTVEAGESEAVAKLQQAVDKALLAGDSGDLVRAVAEYEARVARTRQRFERLEAPPADLPPEHARLLAGARETFAQALAHLEEALSLLQDGSPALDSNLLSSGMERMREGEVLFRQFLRDFKEAEALA